MGEAYEWIGFVVFVGFIVFVGFVFFWMFSDFAGEEKRKRRRNKQPQDLMSIIPPEIIIF